jgi:hypothetical protein
MGGKVRDEGPGTRKATDLQALDLSENPTNVKEQ